MVRLYNFHVSVNCSQTKGCRGCVSRKHVNKTLHLAYRVAKIPSSNVVDAKGISIVAQSRSLTAKAMIYRFVVDRMFGFLYAAIQTRLFPMMLVMFSATQILASIKRTGRLRFGSSKFDI